MSIISGFSMRSLSALSTLTLQISVFIVTVAQPVAAQNTSYLELAKQTITQGTEKGKLTNNSITPRFNRYIVGAGDKLAIQVQPPPGA